MGSRAGHYLSTGRGDAGMWSEGAWLGVLNIHQELGCRPVRFSQWEQKANELGQPVTKQWGLCPEDLGLWQLLPKTQKLLDGLMN